jgi:mRNA-degrading endonuclease RelE of RelBE toxin-antitoxin system
VPEIRWTRSALGYALELSRKNRARILAQVQRLAELPELGTALAGPYEGKRRLVVGRFNVVYEHDQTADEVRIIFIVFSGLR